jgi:hypothetical protein
MDTENRRRFAFVLFWGLLSHVPGVCSEGSSPTQRRYVPLETEDAYIYMDDGGVAVRAEKNWSCRNVNWASTSDPKVFSKPDFAQFRQGQIDGGTWNQWMCKAVVGAVVYSRGIRDAQRKMNAWHLRPDCAPWVPETGRNNWEMLEYDRCLLSEQLAFAQVEFSVEFAARLADILGESIPDARLRQDTKELIAELSAKARKKKLGLYDSSCDKVVPMACDFVECRLAGRRAALRKVEDFLPRHAERVAAQRGRDGIEQSRMDGIAADAASVRRLLRTVLGEAEGS